ncbi:MAG TPA: alpha-hydroxy acid oxidase [Verrucomicrobiae bacterium]|nr:alpha-hydroxy acid oxidase [Verrucomicrobiae bacterium]
MTVIDTTPALARIVNLHELEPLARSAMEPATWDYVAGGAWDELSLAENVAAWRRRTLRPRVLVDVANVTTATALLGMPSAMPIAIAPTAGHGLVHPEGEVATARAAAAAGIPFTLATMSTRSIEEVAAATPDAIRWFQLYVQADPQRTRELVERAAAAGYRAIIVTVDLPVLGYRDRDRRNRFDLPGPLGNLPDVPVGPPPDDDDVQVPDLLSRSLTWADLTTIRGWAPGLPFVLKGILTAEDARLAVEHGAEAIVVSNHGARQLDRVPATIDVLEEIVDAVRGRTEIWVDGGVRRGLDVAIALALGARGVLVGRPIQWGLAVAGQAGVERVLAILREELEIALALLGTPTPGHLTRAHVGA